MISRKAFLFILPFVFLSTFISAQFDQPYFRKIGKNEGLTGSLVLSMVQDSRNIYWIGTLNGLQMFDGRNFKKFPLPFYQAGNYGSNSVSYLLVENDSILWVAHYQGISKFNLYTKEFEFISVPKEYPQQTLSYSSLYLDGQGNVWASSFELGLISYSRNKNRFERAGDEYVRTLKRIRRPLPAGKDRLLILHKNGCDLFDNSAKRIIPENLLPADFKWIKNDCLKGEIFDMLVDSKYAYAQVWNAEKVSYDFIKINKETSEHEVSNIRSVTGRHYYKDRKNNIWLYGDGLTVIHAGSRRIVTIEENIKEGRLIDFTMCHQMFEDSEQNVWLGTNSGLCIFNSNDPGFKICNDADGSGYLKHNYNYILEKSDGKVWAGTFGEGLFMLSNDLKIEKKVDFESITNDQHYDLLWIIYETIDKSEIWLGCQQGRLIRYDNTTQKFSFFNDTVFDNKTIMSITEDKSGNIFFGTNGGRVVQKNKFNSEFSVIYRSRQLESRTAAGTITSLACIDDHLLVGTYYDGIIKLNIKDKDLQHYKMEIDSSGSLKSNNIFCFLPEDNGSYFAGTSNGLGYYNLRDNKFTFYTLYDGLPFSNIYDLVFDNNKNMIATTSDGIYRINWKLKSFERVDKNANLYKGFNSIFLRKGGKELLLADDDYLYSLQVIENQEKKLPPSYIYAVNSSDKTYYPGKAGSQPIKFDKDHNTINIHFGASSFKYHNSIDYYYMLDGIDDNWIPAGANRLITYNELKGGEYIFRLKCVFQENKDHVQELSTSFIIAKPFHQTIWFYILLVVVISAIFYMIYKSRVNKLLAIEKIRFDLSKDLHDDMGSTLSTINILSVMAENKIHKEPVVVKDYLKRINSISQEMMNSMDDIIWSINPVNDNMERVVVRMREFAAGILEPLDINLIFEADPKIDGITTKMKWRRDFFLIFKEAINNAAKYSRCQNLRVQLTISSGNLSLIITDDGKGFDLGNSDNGNGLTNMNKRAAEIGAELQIESKEKMGTRITLSVPLNKL